MKTEVDWGTYIDGKGLIEKNTKVSFDTTEEMLEFYLSLGEFQKGVCGSTITNYLILNSEWVPVSEYHAYLKGEEE